MYKVFSSLHLPIDKWSTRVNMPALAYFIFLWPPKSTQRNSNKNLIYYCWSCICHLLKVSAPFWAADVLVNPYILRASRHFGAETLRLAWYRDSVQLMQVWKMTTTENEGSAPSKKVKKWRRSEAKQDGLAERRRKELTVVEVWPTIRNTSCFLSRS